MQAIKHVTQMKGPNGKSPCHACEIGGVYHMCRWTYYILLSNPIDKPEAIPEDRRDPDADPDTLMGFDPLDLPLHNKRRIARQLDKMDAATTKGRRDDLSTKFGLNGHSILDRIPSIKRPDSFPHKFLHLFLINHGPELVSLWAGMHKGLGGNTGSEDYKLEAGDWAAIGLETEEANKTLPARFT
jgi:hypothetical protein